MASLHSVDLDIEDETANHPADLTTDENSTDLTQFLSIEEALASVGGLSKFQLLLIITAFFNMSGGSSSLYAMSFFELEPEY